jgi:hypothetical protein
MIVWIKTDEVYAVEVTVYSTKLPIDQNAEIALEKLVSLPSRPSTQFQSDFNKTKKDFKT